MVRFETVRVETVRVEIVRVETVRLETVRVETLRVETLRVETVRLETVLVETLRVETVRLETLLVETIRLEILAVETVRLEIYNIYITFESSSLFDCETQLIISLTLNILCPHTTFGGIIQCQWSCGLSHLLQGTSFSRYSNGIVKVTYILDESQQQVLS
ncbi:hypothetical protein Hanom_Chr09g00804161 [Helianthus anomalus]